MDTAVDSYGPLGSDSLGGWSVRAGGLLVLDLARGSVPGSWSRSGMVLLGGEPGGDLVEHFECFQSRLKGDVV